MSGDGLGSAKPTVHLMCGLPGSGKTTYAEALARETRAVRFTLDEWMLTLFDLPHDDPAYVAAIPRCKKLIHEVAQQMLRSGHSVIFDWNHWSPARRAESATWAVRHDAQPLVHFIDVTVDMAAQRAKARAKSRARPAHLLDEAAVRAALDYFDAPSETEGIAIVHFADP